MTLARRGQGPREPLRGRQDLLHWSLLRRGEAGCRRWASSRALEAARALRVGGGVGDAQQVAGDIADVGEPAVLETLLAPVRGAALEDAGMGPDHHPGLQLRHDVVRLLVSDADGGQDLEDREPRCRGLALVLADTGQLLAVRVGVVLLRAHLPTPARDQPARRAAASTCARTSCIPGSASRAEMTSSASAVCEDPPQSTNSRTAHSMGKRCCAVR